MITLLTLVPIVGALAVLLLSKTGDLARLIAIVFAAASFVFSLLFWIGLDPRSPGMQFEERHAWSPSLGISYHVGVDGLGVLLLVSPGKNGPCPTRATITSLKFFCTASH